MTHSDDPFRLLHSGNFSDENYNAINVQFQETTIFKYFPLQLIYPTHCLARNCGQADQIKEIRHYDLPAIFYHLLPKYRVIHSLPVTALMKLAHESSVVQHF